MEDIVKAGRKTAHIQYIVPKSRHTYQHTRSGVQKRRKRQKKGKKVLTKREIGDRITTLLSEREAAKVKNITEKTFQKKFEKPLDKRARNVIE